MIAYVAVDGDTGNECIYDKKPKRCLGFWKTENGVYVDLPKGTIEKLIGKKLTWEDEPVALKEKL